MQRFRSIAARARRVIAGAALPIALGALVASSYPAAQSAVPPARAAQPADQALNAILLELRGLRADLAAGNQRLLAAQLVVGQVQMQEQRIAYLDAQRAAGAVKLADASREVKEMQDRLGRLESECPHVNDVNVRKECEQHLTAEKSRSARLQADEQQLRLALTGLENGVGTEQQRWSELNDRLEVLERSITAR